MVSNVYSVRDTKVGFSDPFICPNDSAASRALSFSFNNATNMVSYSPADFNLYRIGTFDSDTGLIEKCLPEFVCCALDFVDKTL